MERKNKQCNIIYTKSPKLYYSKNTSHKLHNVIKSIKGIFKYFGNDFLFKIYLQLNFVKNIFVWKLLFKNYKKKW